MRKNWCSILKFVYRQLDVLKSFKCFVFFLCCLSKVAFLTSFTAFLELPLKWSWLLIVFLSGLTLFMMSGVIISDACCQDLSPAMCGLFYQDKNAHHHTVALAYHWLTRTRKHSALRYNIDKTLLDYLINQLSMILYSKYGWSSFMALNFSVKIQRQLPLNLKSIFVLDVSKIINLSASEDVFRPKETQLTKSPSVYYRWEKTFLISCLYHLKYK